MAPPIQTVTGPIQPEELGRTLMHEHVLIGFPGWEADTAHPGPGRDEMRAICRDQIDAIRDQGVGTMIDPCPNDLGRDVEFMADIAARTGFRVVCATGLYNEAAGGSAYWQIRGPEASVAAMAELFEKELTEGIGPTGIRAGIIKVATGHGDEVTPYERTVLTAAARAAVATGAPITTHTDEGRLGDAQQQILTENGVAPHRIIIGHSCGTSDHDYHMGLVRGGSYLGFDRFGLDMVHPDAERVKSLLALLRAGAGRAVVVSHDTVWCWRGRPLSVPASGSSSFSPTHFFEKIIPQLRDGGATDAQIEHLLVDNPRAFFAAEPPKLG